MTTTELPAWATAVTVQIPMSPSIHFDRYRRQMLDSIESCERRIRNDFTAELAKLDAYLDTLHGTPAIPAQPPKRRWLRRTPRLANTESN
jgi:hypothetical protein